MAGTFPKWDVNTFNQKIPPWCMNLPDTLIQDIANKSKQDIANKSKEENTPLPESPTSGAPPH